MKFLGLMLLLVAVLAGAEMAATMTVQVRQAKVRSRPSQLGPVVATAEYGGTVVAGMLQKGWYPVTLADGQKGWLHQSALSTKAISMRAGTADAGIGVSTDEVALAGKGFNEQVEKKLREEGTLDFTWVDRMAAFVVTEDQIRQFLAQGSLAGGVQ